MDLDFELFTSHTHIYDMFLMYSILKCSHTTQEREPQEHALLECLEQLKTVPESL